MTWQSIIKIGDRPIPISSTDAGETPINRKSQLGKYILYLDNENETDEFIKKIKQKKFNVGVVRRELNRFLKIVSLSKAKQKKIFADFGPQIDIPISDAYKRNAEKVLEEMPTARKTKGSEKYKRPISKNAIQKYNDFVDGEHQQLIDFLSSGTDAAKKFRRKEIYQWNKDNANKIVKYLRSTKANAAGLMGYDTEGITLLLPSTFDETKFSKNFIAETVEEGFEVTLPKFTSIFLGKRFSGGKPSEPIKRTFFAKFFNMPKYSEKNILPEQSGINIESFHENLPIEYLTEVLKNLSGATRGQFLPDMKVLKSKEHISKIYGVSSSTRAKLLPALEYVLKNTSFNLTDKEWSFAKDQTKESLQRKSAIDKLLRGEYLTDYKSLQEKFNEMVKFNPEKPQEAITGVEKFIAHLEFDDDMRKEFAEIVGGTVARKYVMTRKLRDALLEEDYDDVDLNYIKSQGLGHVFKKEIDVTRLGNDVKQALKNMIDGKLGGLEPNLNDVETLKYLFTEKDDKPFATFISSIQNLTKDRVGGLNVHDLEKEIGMMDSNTVMFEDVVFLLMRLNRAFIGGNNIMLSKVRQVLRKLSRPEKEFNEATNDLQQLIQKEYPTIREAFLTAIQEKMKEVVEMPITHDKEGFQPYEWLRSQGGMA